MSSPKWINVLSLVALVGLAPTLAGADDESSVTVSVGASFDTGDYDQTDDTDTFSIPVSLKYERGDWIAKLSTSYLSVDGSVFPEAGVARVPTSDSGIGDVVAGLSYLIYPENEALPLIELTGKVKLPTADEDDGLGTGETDYSFQVDLSKGFGDFTPFATLGYKVRGDLDDGYFFSIGGGWRLTPAVTAGLIYDYSEASVDSRLDPGPDGVIDTLPGGPILDDDLLNNVEDTRELVPYLNVKLNDRMSLQSYGVIGLSNNAPDYGLGTQLSVGF